jgi:segregation and condensation protein A
MRAFVRLAPLPEMERKLDLGDLGMDHLYKAVQRALRRIPAEPTLPSVRTYAVTVAEQIEKVRDAVRRSVNGTHKTPVRFTALLSHSQTRMEVIVTFLAVLELIKRRELLVAQEETFGEIVLESIEDQGGGMGESGGGTGESA